MAEEQREVLVYDVDEAARLIQREGVSAADADVMARALGGMHPEVFPLVRAWLRGERQEFEFQGVTMAMIMERRRRSYRVAIVEMSMLLEDPARAGWFELDHDKYPICGLGHRVAEAWVVGRMRGLSGPVDIREV